MTIRDKVENALFNMCEYDLIDVINEYRDNVGEPQVGKTENIINEACDRMTPFDIAVLIYENVYAINTDDEYATCDTYGNEISTSDNIWDLVNSDDLIDYIVENREAFGNDALEDALAASEETKRRITEILKGLPDAELIKVFNNMNTQTTLMPMEKMTEWYAETGAFTLDRLMRNVLNGTVHPDNKYFVYTWYTPIINGFNDLHDAIGGNEGFADLTEAIVEHDDDNDIEAIRDALNGEE